MLVFKPKNSSMEGAFLSSQLHRSSVFKDLCLRKDSHASDNTPADLVFHMYITTPRQKQTTRKKLDLDTALNTDSTSYQLCSRKLQCNIVD